MGTPVHQGTEHSFPLVHPSLGFCPPIQGSHKNGARAAFLLPPPPGPAPPVGLLATPRQPCLDPVKAPHEDSLPVKRPAQPQEPTPSLAGSGRSPFIPLHSWRTLLPAL